MGACEHASGGLSQELDFLDMFGEGVLVRCPVLAQLTSPLPDLLVHCIYVSPECATVACLEVAQMTLMILDLLMN